MIASLILLSAGMVWALPASPYNNGSLSYTLAPLSETLRMNGQLVKPVYEEVLEGAGDSSNSAAMDIYQYALEYRKRLQTPTDLAPRDNAVDLPNRDGAHLHVDYSTVIKSCKVSDPQMISSQSVWYCNSGDKCSRAVKLSTTITNTDNAGYKLSAKAKATFDLGPVKTEVELGAEYNKEWSKAKTTTVESTDTWTINYLQSCAPTSYQFNVECESTIKVKKFTMINKDGTEASGAPENICSFFQSDNDRAEYIRGQGLSDATVATANTICASVAKTDASGHITIDLNTEALTPSPVTVQGCRLDPSHN